MHLAGAVPVHVVAAVPVHVVAAVRTVAVPALLHIHLHLHFHLRQHLHKAFRGSPLGYIALALGAAASWIGVPGPGEPLLIAAGVLAAKHRLDLWSVLVVAFVSASGAGITGWLIGRLAGRRVLTAPGPLLHLRLRALERGEEVFERWAVLAIIVMPPEVAGIHGVRAAVFLPVNIITAILWTLGFGLGGYFIGPTVIDAVSDLGLAMGIGIGVVVAIGFFYELRRRWVA